MTILARILRTTWQNLIRHSLISLTAILIITLLFFILNSLVFTIMTQRVALDAASRQLDLALTFTHSASDFEGQTLARELSEQFPDIREINYISAEKAFDGFLNNFSQQNIALANWLGEYLVESPLSASLIVEADPVLHQPVLDWLATTRYSQILNLENTETSELATKTTRKILSLDRTLTRIGWIAGSIFILLSTLIIIAVLRLTILARREEISIARLVGATLNYIRLPFILEGIFFGTIASILGVIAFSTLLSQLDIGATESSALYGGVGELLRETYQIFFDNFVLILGWQILAAILIGIVASLIATSRYLRQEIVLS